MTCCPNLAKVIAIAMISSGAMTSPALADSETSALESADWSSASGEVNGHQALAALEMLFTDTEIAELQQLPASERAELIKERFENVGDKVSSIFLGAK